MTITTELRIDNLHTDDAAILSTGTFTEGHLAELQAALTAGNLDGVYTLSR